MRAIWYKQALTAGLAITAIRAEPYLTPFRVARIIAELRYLEYAGYLAG